MSPKVRLALTRAGDLLGQVGAWPRRVWVLVAVSGAAALVALAGIGHAVTSKPPQHFPGEYKFNGFYEYSTTVSASQAFRDHWLVPPHHIRNLRYSADSPSYAYPYAFVAVFDFPCAEEDGFAKASSLRYGGTASSVWAPNEDLNVEMFAQAQGWDQSDRHARWYYYPIPDTGAQWEQVMITGRTTCTAYVTNN